MKNISCSKLKLLAYLIRGRNNLRKIWRKIFWFVKKCGLFGLNQPTVQPGCDSIQIFFAWNLFPFMGSCHYVILPKLLEKISVFPVIIIVPESMSREWASSTANFLRKFNTHPSNWWINFKCAKFSLVALCWKSCHQSKMSDTNLAEAAGLSLDNVVQKCVEVQI